MKSVLPVESTLMSDPILAAAEKAWKSSTHGIEATAYLAAQEMSKPIREWYEKFGPALAHDYPSVMSKLASLIFSTEELEIIK